MAQNVVSGYMLGFTTRDKRSFMLFDIICPLMKNVIIFMTVTVAAWRGIVVEITRRESGNKLCSVVV